MGGGGAERVVSLLSGALAEKGNDVTVFTLVGGESFYPLNPKIHFESVGISVNRKNKLTAAFSKIKFFPKSFFAIRKKLRKEKYDVVISMLTECDILVGLCRRFGVKCKHICSERNDPTRRKPSYMRLLKKTYKKSSLFVCQGKRVYDYYDCVPESIKKIIPNPIDGETLPERIITDSKRVVGVGRLNKQKNFPLLIKSFASLGDDFKDFRLDIYGEGPERKALEELIENLNVKDRVTLCGAQKNVKELISDAEMFVMSSDYEGFPNALLEAMAIGLPVISTDFSTGIASELIDKENGAVIPVGDEAALTDAMRTLLSDKEKRISMGENNREKCKRFYTPNILAEWESAIDEVVGRK